MAPKPPLETPLSSSPGSDAPHLSRPPAREGGVLLPVSSSSAATTDGSSWVIIGEEQSGEGSLSGHYSDDNPGGCEIVVDDESPLSPATDLPSLGGVSERLRALSISKHVESRDDSSMDGTPAPGNDQFEQRDNSFSSRPSSDTPESINNDLPRQTEHNGFEAQLDRNNVSTEWRTPQSLTELYERLRIPASPSRANNPMALVIQLALNHMFSTYSNIYPFDTQWAAGADRVDELALAVQFYIYYGSTIWNDEASEGIAEDRVMALEALFAGLRTRNFRRGGTASTSSELLQQLAVHSEDHSSTPTVSRSSAALDLNPRDGDRSARNQSSVTATNAFGTDTTTDPDEEYETNEQLLQILFTDLAIFEGQVDDRMAFTFPRFIAQFAYEVLHSQQYITLYQFELNVRQPSSRDLRLVAVRLLEGQYASILWPGIGQNLSLVEHTRRLLHQYLSVLLRFPLRWGDNGESSAWMFNWLLAWRDELRERDEGGDVDVYDGGDDDNADEGIVSEHQDDVPLQGGFGMDSAAILDDAFLGLRDSDNDEYDFDESDDDGDENNNYNHDHNEHENIEEDEEEHSDDSNPSKPTFKCTVPTHNNQPCGLLFHTLDALLNHLLSADGHAFDEDIAREYTNDQTKGWKKDRNRRS